MDRESELDLVQRLRGADTAAFDEVYAVFNARLFTFLVRLARDRARAEDLLEDTWLRLVTHADRLRADTQLGPWLFTVARRAGAFAVRGNGRERTGAARRVGARESPGDLS